MLLNELKSLRVAISSFGIDNCTETISSALIDLQESSETIKQHWLSVFFSEADDHLLNRYFSFHFLEISRIERENKLRNIDVAQSQQLEEKLNELTDYLLLNFFDHLDGSIKISTKEKPQVLAYFTPGLHELKARLHAIEQDGELKNIVEAHLNQPFSQQGNVTLHRLRYFQLLYENWGLLPSNNNEQGFLKKPSFVLQLQ